MAHIVCFVDTLDDTIAAVVPPTNYEGAGTTSDCSSDFNKDPLSLFSSERIIDQSKTI